MAIKCYSMYRNIFILVGLQIKATELLHITITI